MQIRKAKKEDIERISQIERVCFPSEEAAPPEVLRERFEIFGGHFFVLETDGNVIGFINGMVTDEKTISDEMFENSRLHKEKGKWQSVFGLDVEPDYRRQGHAGQLMQALISHAREEKREGLILTCKKELIQYYETFGYRNQGISHSVHGGAVWYDMTCLL